MKSLEKYNIKTAVILAGGKGTRLKPITDTIPKPMVEICGKPILEHQILILKKYGITDIYITVGYLGEKIEAYFGDGEAFGINIHYIYESMPLGTSGAVKYLEGIIDNDFLVIYGDVFFNIKLDELICFHYRCSVSSKNKFEGTIVVHPSDHPYDSDLLEIDDDYRIKSIINKPHNEVVCANLGNAGIYLLTPAIFNYIPENQSSEEKRDLKKTFVNNLSDFMKDIFPKVLCDNRDIYAYKTAEYLKDMGSHERLDKVTKDLKNGKIFRLSKENKRPAIFIDRDGTIVEYVPFISKVYDLKIFPFSSQAIRAINKSDYLSIMVTNQPVVAMNLCDIKTVNKMHHKIETFLGKDGAYFDDIIFCPHHPDKGYPEENPYYKRECNCRKPATGMIEQARLRYNIDMEKSWIIGDTTRDIQTGINAGIKTILVKTGKSGKDGRYNVKPDYVFDNINGAVEFILNYKLI